MSERVDCVVVGAGVVGLAIARSLAMRGREVIILERGAGIGAGISSRNSEVIHAGMYYPQDSLKARLCVAGNRMLRQFAQSHNISHRMTGKLIVATCQSEEEKLVDILQRGHDNGVDGLHLITGIEASAMETHLRCSAAIFSRNTGIVDSYGYMLALLGEAQAHDAVIAYEAPIVGGTIGNEIDIRVGGSEPVDIRANSLVIAAGLSSCSVANSVGLANVPQLRMCKGNYFSLSGKSPFSRLIYPVPVAGGLGIHCTLDLQNRARFGPDVEWVDVENYTVDPERRPDFCAAIRRYWPEVCEENLEPAYSGIRPKIVANDQFVDDFLIGGSELHGMKNVVALYGIESPGLTSSLAIAELVAEKLS